MMAHEVIIKIDQDGNMTFEVKGVKGVGCLELTKKLEAELGLVEEVNNKPEIFQTVGTQIYCG